MDASNAQPLTSGVADGYNGADLAEIVLESSHDGIYITDGEANTIRINKSYENISGLRREDMLGKNMRELVDRGVISVSGTLLALASKKPVTLEQTFNTFKRAIITSSPVFNEKGEIVLVVTNVREITELYQVKRELNKKEALNKKYHKELEAIRRELVGDDDIVAVDKAMLSVLTIAKKVSQIDNPIMLNGASGSGKRRLAKYIHANSSRRKEAFILCDLSGIPQEEMERELFGRADHLGMLELAEGGTLFTGEIQLLPMALQIRLSRFLHDGLLESAHEGETKKLNVRLIASSHRTLDELRAERLLRENLYYTLSVFNLAIPSLKDRPADILPLTERFLEGYTRQYGVEKKLDQSARERLTAYDWPGNVRELQNSVQRAVLISENAVIHGDDLFINTCVSSVRAQLEELPDAINLKEVLAQIESDYMERAYEKHGNTRAAAKSLGMDSSTFIRKRQKYRQNALMQDSSK